jgi:hypothetical protein
VSVPRHSRLRRDTCRQRHHRVDPTPRWLERSGCRRFVREPPRRVDRVSGPGFRQRRGWRWHFFLGPNAPLGRGTTLDAARLCSSSESPTLFAKNAIEWSSSSRRTDRLPIGPIVVHWRGSVTISGAPVFRSLVGQRRGEQAAGHLLSMSSCLSTQDHRPIRQDNRHLGDRMSTANRKTGRHLGNLPQAFSHLTLIEAMPGMIVLKRRAEL